MKIKNAATATATNYRGEASAVGNRAAATATGDRGEATATGDQGAATATGNWGAASATGDQGAATATGNWGAASATGDRGVAVATGAGSKARAADGSALILVHRNDDYEIVGIVSAIAGRDGVKPNVWYTLDEAGGLVEVKYTNNLTGRNVYKK